MTIEINDEIQSRLMLRELGLKPAPLSVKEASLYQLDIEDSFIKPEDDIDLLPIPPVNPDSETE